MATATKAVKATKATTKAAPAAQPATYMLTKAGVRYNPRPNTQHGHTANWAAIQALLKKQKGVVTMAQLTALKATLPTAVQSNHVPFVKYAVRRGWLAVQAAA